MERFSLEISATALVLFQTTNFIFTFKKPQNIMRIMIRMVGNRGSRPTLTQLLWVTHTHILPPQPDHLLSQRQLRVLIPVLGTGKLCPCSEYLYGLWPLFLFSWVFIDYVKDRCNFYFKKYSRECPDFDIGLFFWLQQDCLAFPEKWDKIMTVWERVSPLPVLHLMWFCK